MIESVAFDRPARSPDGAGGTEEGWAEQYICRAEFIYMRGSETVEAAGLSGQSVFKVKIRQSNDAREVTTEWRMRDVRRGTPYNIRNCDNITDRRFIYLTVESGVAV